MTDDYEDKTEQPTPKKLADAKKKGLVTKSQDLTIALLLLLSMVILYFSSGYMFRSVAALTSGLFLHLNFVVDSPEQIGWLAQEGMWEVVKIVFPLLIGVTVGAIAFNLWQTGFIFSFYPLRPKWNHLNVFHPQNYEKMWSWQTLFRMTLIFVRFQLLVVINIGLMCLDASHLQGMGKATVYEILQFIFKWTLIPGFALALMFLALAGIDYVFQRWRYMRQMRMSRREIRDEMRMMEGNEKTRGRIRAKMSAVLQIPLPRLVSDADLVIVDGGNYAIGLKYDPHQMEVPEVVCKGVGSAAIEIKSLAVKFKVPIVENSPLAQAVYRGVRQKKGIQPEHYLQVASALASAQVQQA